MRNYIEQAYGASWNMEIACVQTMHAAQTRHLNYSKLISSPDKTIIHTQVAPQPRLAASKTRISTFTDHVSAGWNYLHLRVSETCSQMHTDSGAAASNARVSWAVATASRQTTSLVPQLKCARMHTRLGKSWLSLAQNSPSAIALSGSKIQLRPPQNTHTNCMCHFMITAELI